MTYSIKYIPDPLEYQDYFEGKIQEIFEEYGHEGGPDTAEMSTEHYQAIIAAKLCGLIIAEDEQGEIAGFITFCVNPHAHYGGMLYGMTDVIWIEPAVRRRNGLTLFRSMIRMSECIAKHVLKAEYFSIGVNAQNPMHKVVERLGYSLSDYQYTRRL